MANARTLARPYAQAVFDYAVAKQALPAWAAHCEHLAEWVQHKDVASLIGHPKVPAQKLADLLWAVQSKVDTDPAVERFVRLLAKNRRLSLLPTIAEQFEALKAVHESQMHVHIVSAQPLTEDFRTQLQAELKQRLAKDIALHTDIDPNLIAGAKVIMNDQVIDATARGKLNTLRQQLLFSS